MTAAQPSLDLFASSQKIGKLGNFLYERSGNLCMGILAIHRGDFASARWWLSMGGFCADEESGAMVAVDAELLEQDITQHCYQLGLEGVA